MKVDDELANLIRGWAYFLIGGIVGSLLLVNGLPLTAIIWFTLAALGLILLIAGFIKYQKPHLREYAQYYRDKYEFERSVLSVRIKKEDKA